MPSTSNLRQSASLSYGPPPWQIGLAVGAVIIIGVSGYMVYSKAMADAGPKTPSIDDMIRDKQYEKALAALRKLKDGGVATRADRDKTDELLIKAAEAAAQEKKFSQAVSHLHQVEPDSPKYKEAQQLIARCKTGGGIGFNADKKL